MDEGLAPWVSMADALGWGMTARPSMTVCAGGARTGGAEPFGNAARQGIERERLAGRWMRSNYSAGGSGTAVERGRTMRHQGQPAVAITGKPGHWSDETGDIGKAQRITVEEAALLQTFPPGYPWTGTKGKQYEQVGNAVPPLLARAIVAEVIGA
jgi:DNA (cytosine-5)-methyltransferase 1